MVMSIGGYGSYGSYGGAGYSSGGNVYANMHAKYGCDYPDFADRPRVAPYPMYAIPKATPNRAHTSWWRDLFSRWQI